MFIKNLINRYLQRRHFWRHVGFEELSELYTSVTLRSIGLSLIGIFIPIYLYKNGFLLETILLFFVLIYLVRVPMDVAAAYNTAKRGPKHSMLYGNLFQVVGLIQLLSLSAADWLLWTSAITFGIASSFYFVGFHIDFSKVIHGDHGGKELGLMSILERFGGMISPLIGGVIATFFGAEYTIMLAIGLLLLASMPLFFSAEPIQTHQKISFKLLGYKKFRRDFVSWAGVCIDNNLTIALWPLFLTLVVFTGTSDYAGVGAIASVGTLAGIVAARIIGRVTDNNKGAMLLTYSAWGGAIVNFIKPFISTPVGAAVNSMASDMTSTGFVIPYIKGFYDQADSLPGYRIVYCAIVEITGDLAKLFGFFLVWIVSIYATDVTTLQVAFVIAGFAALLIPTQRFPALATRRS